MKLIKIYLVTSFLDFWCACVLTWTSKTAEATLVWIKISSKIPTLQYSAAVHLCWCRGYWFCLKPQYKLGVLQNSLQIAQFLYKKERDCAWRPLRCPISWQITFFCFTGSWLKWCRAGRFVSGFCIGEHMDSVSSSWRFCISCAYYIHCQPSLPRCV